MSKCDSNRELISLATPALGPFGAGGVERTNVGLG